ncbi:MAG: nucleotidyltransferase domain-containing protein [Nakamurella sp.]
MTMTASAREVLLSRWIKPSSDNEQDQQDRAWRMVNDAIDAHPVLAGVNKCIYTKGSYPNNTNVRQDSDVDVVVELRECAYYDYASGVTPPASSPIGQYEGSWTSAVWRAEIVKALADVFGETVIDTSGAIAINIPAVAGSRPSADVVPSFLYYRYDDAARTSKAQGSCVWSTSGTKIVNWPDQQLANGKAKNTSTSRRYKNYVRALKNAENALVKAGTITDLPSYFMECLVFNVPDLTLTVGTLDEGFQETLRWLYLGLDDGSAYEKWVEPNWEKWLFKGTQKWSVDDAKTLVLKTWNYLGYA